MTEIESNIARAFASRPKPPDIVRLGHPDTCEYEDAKFFADKRWDELSAADLTLYRDAIYGWSPEAFCYFLPGVLCAGVHQPNLLAIDSIIGMLDRSNMPSSWDDFFSKRWTLLTYEECRAVQDWVVWFSSIEPSEYSDDILSRAFNTLDLLANRSVALPIASR